MRKKLHKQKIAESFSKSAKTYDLHADIQKEMMKKLLSLLPEEANRILDIGCGTGLFEKLLAKKYPAADILGVDIAPGMISFASEKIKRRNIKFLVGDGERLPLSDSTFDLIVSSASLQWMDYKKVFSEAKRTLNVNGVFCFSTFGPKTLLELKKAGLSVNKFPSLSELKTALKKNFCEVKVEKQLIKKKYKDIFDLFYCLKATGAQNPIEVTKKSLLTKNKLQAMLSIDANGFMATYEIYYLVIGNCHDCNRGLR